VVWGLGLGVQVLGFEVQGVRFSDREAMDAGLLWKAWTRLGFAVWGFGFRVCGLGFRVKDSGLKV